MVAAVPLAIATAFAAKDHLRQAEAQNAAMLDQQQMLNHQMWIQNQLLSGRSMSDIQDQIFTEDARVQAAYLASKKESDAGGKTVACFLGVILIPSLIWGLGFVSAWTAIFTFIWPEHPRNHLERRQVR